MVPSPQAILFVTVELSASVLVINFNMDVQDFLSSRRLGAPPGVL